MTRTEREMLKIFVHLGIAKPEDSIKIHRTYAGRHQLAAGTWKWWADKFCNNSSAQWMELCGSSDTCTEIIKACKNDKYYISKLKHVGGLELAIETRR